MMRIAPIFAGSVRNDYKSKDNLSFKGIKSSSLLNYETIDNARIIIKSFNDIYSVARRKTLEGIIELQKLYEDASLFPNDKGIIFKSKHKYNPSVHLRINDEEKGFVFRKAGTNKKLSVNVAMPKKEGCPNLLRIYLKDNRSKPVDLFLIQDGSKVVKNISKEKPYELPETLEYYTAEELNNLDINNKLNDIFDLLDPYILRLKKLTAKKSDTFLKPVEEQSTFIKSTNEISQVDYLLAYHNMVNKKTERIKIVPAVTSNREITKTASKTKTKPLKEKKTAPDNNKSAKVTKERTEKPVRIMPAQTVPGILNETLSVCISDINKKISEINSVLAQYSYKTANRIKTDYNDLELAPGKRSFSFLNKLENSEKLHVLKMDNKKNNNLLKITVTNKDDNLLHTFLIKDNDKIICNYNPLYPNVIPPKPKFYTQDELIGLDAARYIETAHSAISELHQHVSDYALKLNDEKVNSLINALSVKLNIPKCYEKNSEYKAVLAEGYEKLQKTLDEIRLNIRNLINKEN